MTDKQKDVTMKNDCSHGVHSDDAAAAKKLSDIDKISTMISCHTGIDKNMLSILISTFGIETVLNNPHSIGLEEDQAALLIEISDILHSMGD